MIDLPKHIKELIAISTSRDNVTERKYDNLMLSYSEDGACVTSIHWVAEECVIPNGVRVICDDASWIDEEPLLETVTLPDTLQVIGERAFIMQQGLSSMNIPLSLEIVKKEAFKDSRFKHLPDDNNIKVFGDGSFMWSYLEGDIKLLSAVLIGNSAFTGTGITSVELSGSLLMLGDCAFGGCEKLKSITFPSSTKHIGGGVVSGCCNLEHIEILCEAYVLEDGVIYNSDKTELVSSINIEGTFRVPAGVKRICNSAFYSSNIRSIILPRSLKSIGDSAFSCSKLKRISIPDSVTEVGKCAFEYCADLKKIKLPKNLKVIESETFNSCGNIEVINLPPELTHIGESAFASCVKIHSITLPDTLEEIGDSAFIYCESIRQINIPPLVTKLEENTFYGTSLKSVIIPEGVTRIEKSVFGDTELQFVKLPESIKEIADSAFEYCQGLVVALKKESAVREFVAGVLDKTRRHFYYDGFIKYKIVNERLKPKVFKDVDYLALGCPSDLVIPNGITRIAPRALQSSGELHSVVIPGSVTEIGEEAFNTCRELRSIVIPDTVKVLGSNALSFSDALVSVTLPASLTEISSFLFFNCTSLKNLALPSTVSEIGSYAFAFCKLLKEVNIPYGVTRIGDSAFYYCFNLKEIIIPNTVTFIGFAAFGACVSVESITIPSSVQEIEGDILFMSGIKILKVYEDCPVKEELVQMYGSRVEVV